jgi:hypothetical protein
MQIEPLSLSHQGLIGSKFHQLNLPISEYSFANLYLFRHIHHYKVIKFEEEVFIKGLSRDQVPFLMITRHPVQISQLILQKVLSQAQILFPIPENWLTLLEKWLLQASFKEADSDYLYATPKLAHYPGRHLDGKRNQVKQLLNHYELKSENLTQFHDARQILETWQKEHGTNLHQTDYFSCLEAIQDFHLLNLHGRMTYVNQRPAGLMIGEWLSKDCYVVHFSKALQSFKGLYQYLYQDLARSLEKTCAWINLEQDLGIPSLRVSKLSYQPDLLIKKWRVQLQL